MTETDTPATNRDHATDDAAPPALAIIAAYAGTIAILALLSSLVTARLPFGRSLLMAVTFIPMMIAPSFIAAMMTRRSPLPVTISAAALGMLLQPGLLMTRAPGLVGAVIVGIAIWLAATRLPIAPRDARRPIGRAMPLRLWMPAIAIALGFLPFVARWLTNDPFKPVGIATMMIVAPFVWLFMVSWIAAVVPDRIGAFVGRDALRRSGAAGEA